MKVLASLFVESADDDLSPVAGLPIQLAFWKRSTFRTFDHARLLARLAEHGVTVASVHAPAADIYHSHGDEFITMLETIKRTYNVRVITVHPQRGERRQAKALYRKMEERIRELDVVIAYETFESAHDDRKWITQVEDMHRLLDALKYPFLGVTYDFTHADAAKALPELRHFRKHIHAIHMSDAREGMPLDPNEKHQHLALGCGDFPVLEFLDLLQETGYEDFLILEYLPQYRELLREDTLALTRYVAGDKAPFLERFRARRESLSSTV